MPASSRSASGNVTPSRSITNENTSPPSWQPKHFQESRLGVTVNDGVFSPWNGHSPLKVVPAFFSCTVSPTTSTMFSRLLTSAATPPAVFLDLRSAAVPYVREHASVPPQSVQMTDA